MTNSPVSVRWLYRYLVHFVHSDVGLNIHDSLFKPIHTPAISHLIGPLFSEE
jgi:hypothetical protein